MKHDIETLSLFSQPREKGHREWDSFSAIKGDAAGAYRVITPQRSEALRYPNTVHIRRYPRHLTPRFAR